MHKSSEHPQPSPAEPESSHGVFLQENQEPSSSIASEFYHWEEEGGVWHDELDWKTSPVDGEAARVERVRQDSSDEERAGAWDDELDWKPSRCTVRPGEAARAERARHRMEYSTDSQWAVLQVELDEIERGDSGTLLERVLAWRKKRGDFKHYSENEEDDEGNAYLGDVDVPQLPSYMDDVNEDVLRLCFLKSDLQFECLLRNIPYNAADSKPELISKLMEYKDTLSSRATNSFQILQEQCNTSTSNPCFSTNDDDDEAGKWHDVGSTHACTGSNGAQKITMAKCQMDVDLPEDIRLKDRRHDLDEDDDNDNDNDNDDDDDDNNDDDDDNDDNDDDNDNVDDDDEHIKEGDFLDNELMGPVNKLELS